MNSTNRACDLFPALHSAAAIFVKIPGKQLVANFRGSGCMRLLVLVLMTLLPARLVAREPLPGMKLENTERSPLGDILVEHYFNSDNYRREVWLAPTGQSSDRVLLLTHGRSVEVLFSPDQQWLIVNNFPSSTDAAPYLFQRGHDLHYKAVENANISEKTWDLVGKQYPIVLTRDFGHRYVQVLRWANDSGSFLVAAFGHLDSSVKQSTLDPWLCVFTIDGLRVSLDLDLMNRGALHSQYGGENAPSGPWK